MDHNSKVISPDSRAPAASIGTWLRFGPLGPVYQIVGHGHELKNGDWAMRIRVLESGEEVDYPLSRILKDPREN